ncbi:MAG: AgmX/PglI C-terminal domain-containing protein [Myxococcales bacterium]|nr:AgmX/PglI C-terminal domain-containing protein [Myxococcales bacterium]
MLKVRTASLFSGLVLTTLLVSSSASAQEVVHLTFDNDGAQPVVMAASSRGLVFIGADFAPFRAFRARANEGAAAGFIQVEDIDGDREDEYVFAGDPSFVLDSGAAPLFGLLSGCDNFYAGNILEDDNWELFCRNGNTISVWFYDGQFLWDYTVSGQRIGECAGQDVDSDQRLEFGCTIDGNWVLIDLENAEPFQDVDDNPVEELGPSAEAQWADQAAGILDGSTSVDLDGDGSRNETLSFSGGTLTLSGAGGEMLGSATLPASTLYSALVADLNGDGAPEVFLGGDGSVFVVSNSGELVATIPADPNDLSREGRVQIQSANANGLADSSEEATREALGGQMSTIERCYRNRMGDDQFVRVGDMLYELSVGSSGRVDNVRRIHSSVANEPLEECVQGALEDVRFSAAEGGSGSVTVRLSFDFVDQ